MSRLIEASHPETLECSVVLTRGPNQQLAELLAAASTPVVMRLASGPWALPGVLRDLHPDIVYMFGHFRTIWWAMACRLTGVPIVIGAERSTGARLADRASRWLDRWLVDAYIANSKAGAAGVERGLGRIRRPVFVCPNGIEMEGGERVLEADGEASEATPTVACVANIRPLKGQMVLLRAVGSLRGQFPGLTAVLMGNDATDGRLFEEAEHSGLGDTYAWAGFVSDVRPALRKAQVAVLPSLHREGMPTSILEAMALGIPVVASDVGGLRELISDGSTGLLVPPGRVDALAAALGRLLSDSGLRRRLGAAGQARVRQLHGVQTMVKCHVRIFEQLLQERGGRRDAS